MTETTRAGSEIMAVVLRVGFHSKGLEFLTPPPAFPQLASMHWPAGYRIEAHVHNVIHRDVALTQEVLFIKSGRVKVDLYDQDRQWVADRVLRTRDVILPAAGGHGFTMPEPTEMIEVKQGPYVGDRDKTRFDSNRHGMMGEWGTELESEKTTEGPEA
jgi:hypothetical protein